MRFIKALSAGHRTPQSLSSIRWALLSDREFNRTLQSIAQRAGERPLTPPLVGTELVLGM